MSAKQVPEKIREVVRKIVAGYRRLGIMLRIATRQAPPVVYDRDEIRADLDLAWQLTKLIREGLGSASQL